MNSSLSVSLAVVMALTSMSAAADLGERWYGGAAVLRTQLEPDTQASDFSLKDRAGNGYGLFAGYDINRWLAVEATAVNLGAAELRSDNGTQGMLDYSAFNVSAMAYLPLQRPLLTRAGDLADRSGASVFLRAGASALGNHTALPYRRANDLHWSLGGGLEFGHRNGSAVRLTGERLSGDVSGVSLAYIKRFAILPGYPLIQIPLDDAAGQAASARNSVSEGSLRQLADFAHLQIVTKKPPLDLPLPTLFFNSRTAIPSISSEQLAELARLARTLKAYPGLRLEVVGYSSADGAAKKNLQLSQRRAKAVARYLRELGVAASQMQIRGQGSDDQAVAGQGRRVELRLASG